jgi:N-acetylglutamate synthase-like GNAT family acetyltransferase
MEILKDAIISPEEIEDLREAVGWDRSEGIYKEILKRHFAYYAARNQDGNLIAYMSVLSDGIADAFLLDLMVHPKYKNKGLGIKIVKKAITDIKEAGVKCVHVTFDENLESFYAKCGFHIFKGGIIDFKCNELNCQPDS